MRKEIKKTIGEHEYIFFQFNATDGLKIWVKLLKLLGAPLGIIINNVADNKKIEAIDLKNVSIDKAVEILAENLDAENTVALIKEILQSVIHNGKRVSEIFDVHFQGNYTQLFTVVYGALEVNYKDFLLELAGKAGLKAIKQ